LTLSAERTVQDIFAISTVARFAHRIFLWACLKFGLIFISIAVRSL